MNKIYLFAGGDHRAAIAAPAPHDAVDPPPPPDGDHGRVHVAVDLHLDLLHLQRDQRRRVAPPVNVRLVARYVGIVHHRRVVDHRVHHRRRRQQPRSRRSVHPRRWPRRC